MHRIGPHGFGLPPPPARRRPWSGLTLVAGLAWAVALCAVVSPARPDRLDLWPELMAAGAAGCAALFGLAARRQRRREDEKRSDDLTAVSERLLRLENRPGTFDAVAGLRKTTVTLAADLELVGQLVTTLGETVDEQDRRLQRLEGAGQAETRTDQPSPIVSLSGPPRLESQADFADATALILRRLSGNGTPARADARSGPAEARPDIRASAEAESRTSAGTGTPDGNAALDALAAGRIELHMQPVISLPQRKTILYDAIGRLKGPDGTLLPVAVVADALKRHGRTAALDRDTMAKAVEVARYLGSRGGEAAVVVPVSPGALADEDFIRDAERLLGRAEGLGSRIVLAIRQRDLRHLGPDETAGVLRLTGCGTRLRLDGVGDLGTDWAELVRRGFDYATVDCGLILEPRDPGETGRLVDAARMAGLHLIASAVDGEALVPDLLDFDVPLAQGPVFGASRPVRADILPAGALPAGAPADPSTALPAPAHGWASFRDHLRRAG